MKLNFKLSTKSKNQTVVWLSPKKLPFFCIKLANFQLQILLGKTCLFKTTNNFEIKAKMIMYNLNMVQSFYQQTECKLNMILNNAISETFISLWSCLHTYKVFQLIHFWLQDMYKHKILISVVKFDGCRGGLHRVLRG